MLSSHKASHSTPTHSYVVPHTPLPEREARPCHVTVTPDTCAVKLESFERINSIRETYGNFDSCDSYKWLVPSHLHESHESKFLFTSRIEFIRSKLSNLSAHVLSHVYLSAQVIITCLSRVPALPSHPSSPQLARWSAVVAGPCLTC